MSDKTHCDRCDAVIAPTAQRLTLKVGLGRGDDLDEEAGWHDFCPTCVEHEPILRRLFAAQRATLIDAGVDAAGR